MRDQSLSAHCQIRVILIIRNKGCSKPVLSPAEGRPAISPAQTQGRQDALVHGQGHSRFDARSVLTVHEHERRWRLLQLRSGHVFSTFLEYLFYCLPGDVTR
ncbi:MAG: hypothetical protein VST68_03645 [Nitrospirota bacterium]|nr:hypothetical protein [Nitrospirota bacterium]